MNIPHWVDALGLAAAAVMPFWNIPLILRIWKRKSSNDISLPWVIGVWVCAIAMLPSSISSADAVLKIFGTVNAALFSGVFAVVLKFHGKNQN